MSGFRSNFPGIQFAEFAGNSTGPGTIYAQISEVFTVGETVFLSVGQLSTPLTLTADPTKFAVNVVFISIPS